MPLFFNNLYSFFKDPLKRMANGSVFFTLGSEFIDRAMTE